MMPPEDPPKLRTWPFLLGDGTLLATAAWIASKSAHPGSGAALVAIVTCVALAAGCGVIPFLANYGRQQDAALDERQRALEALTGTLQASADQISIAAASLHQLATTATAAPAAGVPTPPPSRIPAQWSDIQSSLAELRSELAKLHPAPVPEPIAKVVPFEPPAPSLEALPLPADAVSALAATPPPAVAADLPSPGPVTAAAPPPESLPAEAAPPAAPRKRTPRKSPPPSPAASVGSVASVPVVDAAPAPVVENPEPAQPPVNRPSDTSRSDPEPVPNPDAGESALSADGATRLLVTAYIGIGNRLFLRGEGPGLSWERGVPLQFVSIGKWRWETAEAAGPIAFKLYKNDEIECSALGLCSLAPGRQQEFRATF